jgi:hypothetical protein
MTFRRLSKPELRDLSGRMRRDCIVRWLREGGWVFEVDANGWPIVSASYAEARLGGGQKATSAAEPDFAALGRAA